MASPVGEDNWVDFVDHQSREATDFEKRVNVVESFRRAVSAEPGSIKVWMAYCEYFWSLHIDCQANSDAGWPLEEQLVGQDTFTINAALNLWQEGYEAVQYRIGDSHELWDRWASLELSLLRQHHTEAAIRRVSQIFKTRLATPHATWDTTSQMFSSFLTEYKKPAYEFEMQQVTKDSRDAKRLYELRDPFEMRLQSAAKSGDAEPSRNILIEYLDWEIRQTKARKDALTNFRICLGLFSRALTGILVSHEATWQNYIVFTSTSHSDVKSGRSKIPLSVLPNTLDVLQGAVRHLPWSGPTWARYILAAEESGLPFADIERIKHAATNSAQLDRDGMTGVLDMYSAWCGYLKRTAMDPNATEEATDLAEVGLPSALEDVKHWGKRRYGDAYQGDPNFRLEKILIQFLTEKKDDVSGARAVWEQLSTIELHAKSYDFWLSWFLWEMVVFAAAKSKMRSPTPTTNSQGLRIPSYATRVFEKALKVSSLDWPERIMDVYLQHCNDYELAETLREAQDTIYKNRKRIAKRREREAAQQAEEARAAFEAQALTEAASHDQNMEDSPEADTSSGPKRKREPTPVDDDAGNKRLKNSILYGEGDEVKRDRENTSVFMANLPSDVTVTKVKQFFRGYGHVNNIDLQKQEGAPPVALIEFRSPDDAQSAMLRDGKYFGSQVVQVTPATDCTLYVTNYPPEADEQFIRDLFKDCGAIHSIRFPSLKYNARRRFCYLTFRDRGAAALATKLDRKSLEGGKYKLLAKLSDPAAKQQRNGAQIEERELHVLNLPRSTTEDELHGLFSKAGTVVSVRLLRNRVGVSQGAAFIVMSTKEEAQEAIKLLDQLLFGHRAIKVELSKPVSQKTSITIRHGSEGSPEAGSPADPAARSQSPGATSGGPTPADIAARTIAVLNIPDTMNPARVQSMLAPTGTIAKLTLHAKYGGVIVEYVDAQTARKAGLAIEGMVVDGGKKLHVDTVAELFRQKGEVRVDRIDQEPPKKTKSAAELMPPPAIRRPPVLGRGGARRGLGFVSLAKKEPNGSATTNGGSSGSGTAPTGQASKSNADFKKMFLG
ncbi:hypothetical protein B0T26DRAFT_736079 [Lasiosphaeria miniovina]|uniref:U4/U6 snRNA-associated-splicing factor PRP24 n=1 Tax=Lasiosphaeria miniovina TaxID=1954250 RepID=A0AA40BEU8_9PEZI|nr:uncharacterized protein B0T26DRAFT_736079 [Lasiosphaeria miniovina]KAK0732958.1 hypothetical protein B0T26DRAFT_736079 [Lasiosphaeria miniovina]